MTGNRRQLMIVIGGLALLVGMPSGEAFDQGEIRDLGYFVGTWDWTDPETAVPALQIWELIGKRPQPLASMDSAGTRRRASRRGLLSMERASVGRLRDRWTVVRRLPYPGRAAQGSPPEQIL